MSSHVVETLTADTVTPVRVAAIMSSHVVETLTADTVTPVRSDYNNVQPCC